MNIKFELKLELELQEKLWYKVLIVRPNVLSTFPASDKIISNSLCYNSRN